MKALVSLLLLGALAWVIAIFHPFQLAMPWQTGDAGPVNDALEDITADLGYGLREESFGRLTPFNFVASAARFETRDNPATACTDLLTALDRWGVVQDTDRRPDGCTIKAAGLGPMTALAEVVQDPDLPGFLVIDVRVQHAKYAP